jgi:hypothetical protein
MKSYIYIPRSLRSGAKHLRHAFKGYLASLPKKEFLRVWCSVAYLYPGLHPDGFEDEESGWPRVLRPLASEAWRRADTGEISDNELYCYQCCKARIRDELKEAKRKYPWLSSDHFAA